MVTSPQRGTSHPSFWAHILGVSAALLLLESLVHDSSPLIADSKTAAPDASSSSPSKPGSKPVRDRAYPKEPSSRRPPAPPVSQEQVAKILEYALGGVDRGQMPGTGNAQVLAVSLTDFSKAEPLSEGVNATSFIPLSDGRILLNSGDALHLVLPGELAVHSVAWPAKSGLKSIQKLLAIAAPNPPSGDSQAPVPQPSSSNGAAKLEINVLAIATFQEAYQLPTFLTLIGNELASAQLVQSKSELTAQLADRQLFLKSFVVPRYRAAGHGYLETRRSSYSTFILDEVEPLQNQRQQLASWKGLEVIDAAWSQNKADQLLLLARTLAP